MNISLTERARRDCIKAIKESIGKKGGLHYRKSIQYIIESIAEMPFNKKLVDSKFFGSLSL